MRHPATMPGSGSAFGAYLDSYRNWLSRQSMTKNTKRAYYSRIKQFMLFRKYARLDENPLNDSNATNEAIKVYLSFLKKTKSADRSINANINALNNFLNFLSLKTDKLKRERCYYKAPKVLKPKEQEAFLMAAKRQDFVRDRALAMVLFYTGLRLGECAALEVTDVLEVVSGQSEQNKQSHDICLRLKNKEPGNEAIVPLNNLTAFELTKWLKKREEISPAKEGSLWLTKEGRPLSISGITFVIKRIGWQAQLSVSTETLRRTCISNLVQEMSNQEASAKLGNYLSQSTIRRYSLP